MVDGRPAGAGAGPAERPGRRPDAAADRAPAQSCAGTGCRVGAGLGGGPGRGRVAARRLCGLGRGRAPAGQTPHRAGVRLRGGAGFWAVGRFIRDASLVERSVDQLAAGPEQATTPVFPGMASTLGPLALTLVFVMVTVWRTAVVATWGRPWGGCRSRCWSTCPADAVWVYLALLVGLYRLGRRTCRWPPFPGSQPGSG